jgi:hypothetical protein
MWGVMIADNWESGIRTWIYDFISVRVKGFFLSTGSGSCSPSSLL